MSTFAIVNTGDVIPAVNYLLSNLDTAGNANVTIPGNVLVANTTTGVVSQFGNASVFAYLYQYVNLRYSNNATGTAGFDTNSNNYSYFGVYNSAGPTPSANPVSYQWFEVSPPFDAATSRTLYYSAIGGRQIQWAAASSPPNSGFQITTANVAIDLDVVTTATGTPGERGPIAMAYVITTADPTTASSATLTGWWEASRTASVPPIGTGLTPVPGDTAFFTYPDTGASATFEYNGSVWTTAIGQVVAGNVLVSNTVSGTSLVNSTITGIKIANSTITGNLVLNGTLTGNKIVTGTLTTNLFTANSINANIIQANTFTANTISGQAIIANTFTANTINGNSIVAGSITAEQLAANVLIANTVISTGATIGNFASPGFWLQGNTGNARFGNTVSIGNNLTVGNNATIGGNLAITGLVTAGTLNANTVQTTTIVPAAVSSGVSNSSSTNQDITNPLQATRYFTNTTSVISVTAASQPVYVWAQVLNIFDITPSTNYVILVLADLIRTDSLGVDTVIFSQSFTGSQTFNQFSYQARPIWAGFIDTPGIGTFTYRMAVRWVNAGGAFTVNLLRFNERSVLTQTLRR